MEFFRWFLILAGVAMLVVTYLLGRRKVDSIDYRRSVAEAELFDPSLEDLSVPISGRPSDDEPFDHDDMRFESTDRGYADGDEFLSDSELDDVIPTKTEFNSTDNSIDMGISDDDFYSDQGAETSRRGDSDGSVKSFASAVKQANQRKSNLAPADDFSSEFETYSEQPVEAETEEKIVTVHITARDQKFDGADLKTAFDAHGYKFGKMSIYHCSHEQKKVFSVANLVKPGSFDVDNMGSFATPGITLFMRLPVALDADVAFDFLIREASELADELGGQLRDADRSTLSKQTIQHMREDIQQYVFRQKRAVQA